MVDSNTKESTSIQIWYEGKGDKVDLVLDINVWRLKNKKGRNIYLDFGIRIEKPADVDKIQLYFPFGFNIKGIADLGSKLSDQELLTGIFNENYVVANKNKKLVVRKEIDASAVFTIYKLDVNSKKDITVISEYSGTVVSIGSKKINGPIYYRIRIEAENYGTLFEKYKPKNSFFESAMLETEVIDFRINEKRNQNSGLLEEINENHRFVVKDINFFVMSPIQDEIESDGNNLIYKRQLEMGEFWSTYLGMPYEKMSVYKCKVQREGAEIEDFSCFCKIKYRKSNLKTIVIYVAVLLLMTVAFNVISNVLWMQIEPFFNSISYSDSTNVISANKEGRVKN